MIKLNQLFFPWRSIIATVYSFKIGMGLLGGKPMTLQLLDSRHDSHLCLLASIMGDTKTILNVFSDQGIPRACDFGMLLK